MDKLIQTYLRFHYPFQDIIGRIFAWGVLSLVIITSLVVILRYGFETGSIALQETITYNHAILFMLGISYTYLHDEHVRVDVFYSRFSPQRKQWVNLLGSILFTLPITLYILWSSWDYVSASWAISESSPEAGGLGYVYLLKTLILIMATLLLLQAVAVIGKSWLQLKNAASNGSEEQKPQGGKL